jgi:hypothetical protein
VPGNQPRLQFAIDLEIQPRRHSRPPHPAGETYHPMRTNIESIAWLPDRPNPGALAGDQGQSPRLDDCEGSTGMVRGGPQMSAIGTEEKMAEVADGRLTGARLTLRAGTRPPPLTLGQRAQPLRRRIQRSPNL